MISISAYFYVIFNDFRAVQTLIEKYAEKSTFFDDFMKIVLGESSDSLP